MSFNPIETITLNDYPTGARELRVRALAAGARKLDDTIAPDLLLRAAIALDRMTSELVETAVVMVAVLFSTSVEQTPQTEALLRADIDSQAPPVAELLEPRLVSLIGYPVHDGKNERVVALADGAKQALFGGGCPPLPDDLLLRAAIALDSMPREIDACQATLTLARNFAPSLECYCCRESDGACLLGTTTCGKLQAERDALLVSLASRLHDPVAELARACENNRRLMGS